MRSNKCQRYGHADENNLSVVGADKPTFELNATTWRSRNARTSLDRIVLPSGSACPKYLESKEALNVSALTEVKLGEAI